MSLAAKKCFCLETLLKAAGGDKEESVWLESSSHSWPHFKRLEQDDGDRLPAAVTEDTRDKRREGGRRKT